VSRPIEIGKEKRRGPAARIHIENAVPPFNQRLVRVPADDSRKPCCRWIKIERLPVVQHVKGVPVQGHHFGSRQVRARTTHIDIAADSGDRSHVAQRVQNGSIPDIPRMQDVLDSAQSFQRRRAEQTMGIGNNADHKPMSSLVRGSR
jgi:hypothetical protein